jgi:hypothetical protein
MQPCFENNNNLGVRSVLLTAFGFDKENSQYVVMYTV